MTTRDYTKHELDIMFNLYFERDVCMAPASNAPTGRVLYFSNGKEFSSKEYISAFEHLLAEGVISFPDLGGYKLSSRGRTDAVVLSRQNAGMVCNQTFVEAFDNLRKELRNFRDVVKQEFLKTWTRK